MMIKTTFTVISCLMLAFPAISFAENKTLGRLFHSPESRAELEHKRGMKPKPVTQKRVVKKAPIKLSNASLPLPDPIMLQGYVKRSDGPNTVWINDQPVRENSQTQSIKIGRITKRHQSKQNSLLAKQNSLNKIDQLLIKIPANGKVIQLKPGQRYDPEQNRVDDITVISNH